MARFHTEGEISLDPIEGRKVAIIGYGNQGHAHALNLRDGGYDVVVGLRNNSPREQLATEAGLKVNTPALAAKEADWIMLCVPDQTMATVFEDIRHELTEDKTLLFAHGFAVVFNQIQDLPAIDIILVGPKGSGRTLRNEFLLKRGLASLVAVHQDVTGTALDKALAYAKAIGCAAGRCLETTFREETVTDLFGEQVVLCGGIPELLKAGYDTLVEAGYSPETAFFECIHEAKLITDLIYESGVAGMRKAISDTAAYGGLISGSKLIDTKSRETMREILADIESGTFANKWVRASATTTLGDLKVEEAKHGAEDVGAELRAHMPFLPS
ncbi:MAG: ketol-acid reductoisomerase [Armatimonadetes bacterium]|nr:ketol-acid reductoisomerase [Armatimonadota bacterium]